MRFRHAAPTNRTCSEGTMTSVDPSTSSTHLSPHRPMVPPAQRGADTPRPAPSTYVVPAAAAADGSRQPDPHNPLSRVRAWMLVPPVDALLLVAPVLWAPQQWRAHVTMAVLGLVLLTGGTRYRARLHLSVLDELPTLLARLF